MAFDNNDREYARPVALPDWLKEFAEQELKKASPFEDIKNIFNKGPDAVEAKVQELQKQIGLHQIEKNAVIRQVERDKERGEGKTTKWCVYPKSPGYDKALGCHNTKEEAEEQLRAIEANKADDAQYHIKEEIFGGFGDGHNDDRYDQEQLDKGIKVELEHTNDPSKAKEIAKDHLEESKDFSDEKGGKYYDKLEQMEEAIEEEIVNRARKIEKLIVLANQLDDAGRVKEAIYIDKQIKKLAEQGVFEKYPGIKKHIDNICKSRQGHINAPALLDIIRGRPEKLLDKEIKEIKEYINKRIKEEKKELNLDSDDDIIGLETTTFVVNEDDENNKIFSEPAKV